MENPGYEKDSLRGPPGNGPPAGPPPYGAVNMPPNQPPLPPQYYPGAEGYAMPANSGFAPMNPRYQGYSPLYNDNVNGSLVLVRPATHTTLIAPVYMPSEPDYLCYSIFNLLCCCLPLGIVALIYSLKTQDCNARGDVVGARHNSQTARTFNRVALALGVAIFVMCLLCVIFLVIIPHNQHPDQPPPFHFGG
ncbi:interferon-induced transmembrane protein 3-like [Ambystoma mexicanum]|uniref:interferon-induced transmembrane protein 3-like n=1 Tax=Ambystoma mexicanum TaxID=8296 RepID=UPI0037E8D286